MIPLIINKENRLIPTISDMKTGKFIELIKLDNFNLIDYLAINLEMSRKVVESVTVKNPSFLAQQLYGKIPDYSKVKHKVELTIEGKKYLLTKDFTLGQRFLIEENGKGLTGGELAVLILAVNCDQENYSQLLEKINDLPASETMPSAFFLARRFLNGNSLGQRFLTRLLQLIRIPSLKNRRVAKS